MQFITIILSLAAVGTAVSAAPVESATSEAYYLQTKSTENRFNGLYLTAYHTGAGINDLVLSTEKPSFTFYTNGTQILGQLGSTVYGLQYEGNINYDEWYPSTFNAGGGDTGYSFSSTGDLQNTPQSGEYGWLACDWAHYGIPQLFETVVPNPHITSNCAKVNVTKVAA